jgi:hypothetical protein
LGDQQDNRILTLYSPTRKVDTTAHVLIVSRIVRDRVAVRHKNGACPGCRGHKHIMAVPTAIVVRFLSFFDGMCPKRPLSLVLDSCTEASPDRIIDRVMPACGPL